MTPFVQTKVVEYFTRILEKRTGTTIVIGRVEFRPIESLVLKDVFVQDYRKDTLLHCEHLSLKIDSVSFVKQHFTITEATFEKALFKLWIQRGEGEAAGVTNVEELISSLSVKQSEQPSGSIAWNVNLAKMTLRDCQFKYIENVFEPLNYGINWTDVDCRKLNLTVSDIKFSGNSYGAQISELSFIEKSGFEVVNMAGKMVATDGNLLVTNTLIHTKRSEAHLDTLEYNWVPEQGYWRDFVTKMQQRYVFSASSVHFDDLAFFNENLLGMNNTISGSGVVFNTISNLQGRDLEVYFGDKSVVHGAFTSSGLPRFFDTDFELDFTESQVSPLELEAIYMPWLKSHYVKIPEMLHKYNVFCFDGKFRGKIEDFVLTATSNTPGILGDVVFNYQVDSIGDMHYDGQIGLRQVEFGFLIEQSFLGNGSFFGNFDGVLGDTTSRFNLSSRIAYLDILETRVHDIKLSLGTQNDRMCLLSSVKNDSLRANFMLNYQMGDSLTLADAEGYVNIRQWDSWGRKIFGEKESFEFDFSGKLRASEGNRSIEMLIPKLKYENTRGIFETDTLKIDNTVLGDYCFYQLQSAIGDGTVEGFFNSLKFEDLWNSLIVSYLPAYRYAVNKPLPDGASLSINMNLKDVNPLLRVVYPQLKVSRNVLLACDYNYLDRHVNLSLTADTIEYGDLKMHDSRVKLKGDGLNLQCIYTVDEMKYLDFGRLYNVRNTMDVNTNNVRDRLTWSNWGRESYCGSFSANLRLLQYGERHLTQVFIQPSVFVMADSVWHVGRSMILKEEDDIFVNNFQISRGKQSFVLKGRISENPRDVLSMIFNDFDLVEFNKILFDDKVKLFGRVNGQMDVRDLYKDRLIYANVNVDQWGMNRDTLGALQIHSRWDDPSSALIVNVSNEMKGKIPFRISGYYKPSVDSLDMRLALSKISMRDLTKYFPDVLKEGSGTISGELAMKGSTQGSTVNGYLAMDTVSLTLAGLNTAFKIDQRLPVRDNRILLNNFKVSDPKDHTSLCSGYYDLGKNLYDINLKFDNFQVLNTKQDQSDSFYGQLNISGQTRLNNLSSDRAALSVNLRPEAHSVLYIPLSSALTEEDGGFLHFISNRQAGERRPTDVAKPSLIPGFDLNANIEINNNLEVQIIFDPTIGDILKTVGSGNMRFSLGKDNELNMFGEYKVEKGDYLFTLSNLINKKFVLNPGGSIKWNGSPYDATMDVSAIYNLKTSLNDLLAGTTTTMEKNAKVPVECVLNLTESLMNPNVQFGIDFPSLDMQMRGMMQSFFSSQDEVNKQMFSLLILNKFYTPDYVDKDAELEERNTGYQVGVTTASELLSNQLSRWLSQISNNFDIGFSYRPGDQVTTNEFEVALSTQIWNNRVTLSANGNMMEKAKTNSNTSITGDFDVDVKLNSQGTLKLKAYSHTDEKITYNATETVQGVGVSYQETFDTFRELLRKYIGIFKRKKNMETQMQVFDPKN